MTSVALDEARTRLTELVDEVARGGEVVITRAGKPATLLVPASVAEGGDVREVVEGMLAYRDRQKRTFGGKTLREFIDEGRRF